MTSWVTPTSGNTRWCGKSVELWTVSPQLQLLLSCLNRKLSLAATARFLLCQVYCEQMLALGKSCQWYNEFNPLKRVHISYRYRNIIWDNNIWRQRSTGRSMTRRTEAVLEASPTEFTDVYICHLPVCRQSSVRMCHCSDWTFSSQHEIHSLARLPWIKPLKINWKQITSFVSPEFSWERLCRQRAVKAAEENADGPQQISSYFLFD